MRFMISVRWHPADGNGNCSSAWLCTGFDTDGLYFVMFDASGLVVKLRLDVIERIEIERK